MTLKEMIFKRKSCRSFTGVPVDAATMETFHFFKTEHMTDLPGYGYVGSCHIEE